MKEEQFTINDLEKLTGIRAHTIRIWEKRYSLLEPSRTKTNIRYYSTEDLKKLLNISILNKNGIKISRIAELKDEQISEKVIEMTSRNSDLEDQVQSLIMAMFNLNTQKFEKLLTISYINRGFESTYTEIINPFLTKVGFLWQAGTITAAQEHFASNIIRRKIIVAIDGVLASFNDKSKHFVVFLPEDEFHEIGILYSYYLIKKYNHYVTYLGASVPLVSIDEINITHQCNYLLTSFTASYSAAKIKEYLESISTRFNQQTIFVTGPQIQNYTFQLPQNVKRLTQIEELLTIIR